MKTFAKFKWYLHMRKVSLRRFIDSSFGSSFPWPLWQLKFALVIRINDANQKVSLDLWSSACGPVTFPILPLQMVMTKQLAAELRMFLEVLGLSEYPVRLNLSGFISDEKYDVFLSYFKFTPPKIATSKIWSHIGKVPCTSESGFWGYCTQNT